MSNDQNLAASSPRDAELVAPAAVYPLPAIAEDPASANWPDICAGIVVAGGVYPVAVVAIFSLYGLSVTAWDVLTGVERIPSVPALAAAAMAVGGAAFFLGVLGLFYTFFIIIFTTPVIYLFVRTLKLRCDLLLFGAIWGGLIGLVAVLPFFFRIASEFGVADDLFSEVLLPLFVGPGLATIFGQLGGAMGGARVRRQVRAKYEKALARAEANRWRNSPGPPTERGFPASGPARGEAESRHATSVDRPRFQFGIRHLLWITVWLSVLLSVIRLAGIPFEYVLPLLIGWLVYQSATLYVGWRFIRRWQPWWARLQSLPTERFV